jgi:hypothetical protein
MAREWEVWTCGSYRSVRYLTPAGEQSGGYNFVVNSPAPRARGGSVHWSGPPMKHASDLASPPVAVRAGTAQLRATTLVLLRYGPGFVKTTHLNSPPPSPTQSFEPSDDETQHPRDADGDNVSAATTYAHTQEARV